MYTQTSLDINNGSHMWNTTEIKLKQNCFIRVEVSFSPFMPFWKQESRSIARRTAWCRCKFRYVYVSKFTAPIEFYNKTIMERLCTLNTATLSTRTHLAPKPACKTPWIAFRGHSNFKVTHLVITEKPTRDYVLVYNNVGFRVGNFEENVWPSWQTISVFENPTVISAPPAYRELLRIFAQSL